MSDDKSKTAVGPFVTIHLRDVPAVVKAKAGAAASFLATLAPKTIEAQVYEQVRSKVTDSLKAEGVDADVVVVESLGAGASASGGVQAASRFPRDLVAGAAIGVALSGIGWAIKRIFFTTKGR